MKFYSEILKIILFLRKRAASDYRTLISFGLILAVAHFGLNILKTVRVTFDFFDNCAN